MQWVVPPIVDIIINSEQKTPRYTYCKQSHNQPTNTLASNMSFVSITRINVYEQRRDRLNSARIIADQTTQINLTSSQSRTKNKRVKIGYT